MRPAPRPLLGIALLAAVAWAALGQAGPLPLWPDGAGHDHSDPAQHAAQGFGMELLGHVALGEAIGELDVRTDPLTGRTWVAVTLSQGAGFALLDGTDPTRPTLVSVARSEGYGTDAKLADDTATVYLTTEGTEGLCYAGLLPFVPTLAEPLPCGVQVWDTRAKGQPVFLGTMPSSLDGSHMMDYEVLRGQPTLAMSARGTPEGVQVAQAHRGQIPQAMGRADTGFAHDVTLRADPLDPERALAFVANWDDGVRVFDLAQPALPEEVAHWPVPDGSGGRIHTVMPLALEGRRFIVAGQETPWMDQVSRLFFLDATDLGDVRLVGTWGNPDGHTTAEGGLRWSTHDFNLEGGKLLLAHYHAGVLVLDVSTPERLASPVLLGNYVPHEENTAGLGPHDVPLVWDAVPHKDVVWASDVGTGLYALRLTPSPPG